MDDPQLFFCLDQLNYENQHIKNPILSFEDGVRQQSVAGNCRLFIFCSKSSNKLFRSQGIKQGILIDSVVERLQPGLLRSIKGLDSNLISIFDGV